VVGRHRASIDKASPLLWRAVFASAGFTPVQTSTFAESQAESLLHKVPVRGFRFRVEKRAPGSLCLYLTFVCSYSSFHQRTIGSSTMRICTP
jgi:hypothetical protein